MAQRQTVDLELTNSVRSTTSVSHRSAPRRRRELSDLRAEATEQIAAQRKNANDEINRMKSETNDQIESALAEANKKLADVREQVSKMMTDAQRRPRKSRIPPKPRHRRSPTRPKCIAPRPSAKVNAEVEQIRADISAQQDEATKKVNELLADLNERREIARSSPTS